MNERQSFKLYESRVRLFNRSGGKCEVCGEPILFHECQLAHRIPQTKANLKLYGKTVIHHDLNIAVVCSLACNSAVLINRATRPVEADELLQKIHKELA